MSNVNRDENQERIHRAKYVKPIIIAIGSIIAALILSAGNIASARITVKPSEPINPVEETPFVPETTDMPSIPIPDSYVFDTWDKYELYIQDTRNNSESKIKVNKEMVKRYALGRLERKRARRAYINLSFNYNLINDWQNASLTLIPLIRYIKESSNDVSLSEMYEILEAYRAYSTIWEFNDRAQFLDIDFSDLKAYTIENDTLLRSSPNNSSDVNKIYDQFGNSMKLDFLEEVQIIGRSEHETIVSYQETYYDKEKNMLNTRPITHKNYWFEILHSDNLKFWVHGSLLLFYQVSALYQ